jgi:DNA-binding HxlR family transcriptional regulator
VPYRPFETQNCSIAGALSVIGERWTLLVMREILLGRRRFREIRRQTGIAPNILSDRLNTLVEHGLLVQKGDGEYAATPKGLDLNPVLIALMQWGDRHVAGETGAPRIAMHAVCGHDTSVEVRCPHCETGVPTRELRVRPGPGASPEQIAAGVLPVV